MGVDSKVDRIGWWLPTDGEGGTACWACRLVGITGAPSVLFDADVAAEVAWFMGTRQDSTKTEIRVRALAYHKE